MRAEQQAFPDDLAREIDQVDFLILIHHFLYEHLQSGSDSDSNSSLSLSNISLGNLPEFHRRVAVYNSAVAMFYVLSDLSGVGGMRRKHIHAVKS